MLELFEITCNTRYYLDYLDVFGTIIIYSNKHPRAIKRQLSEAIVFILTGKFESGTIPTNKWKFKFSGNKINGTS